MENLCRISVNLRRGTYVKYSAPRYIKASDTTEGKVALAHEKHVKYVFMFTSPHLALHSARGPLLTNQNGIDCQVRREEPERGLADVS